MQYLLDALNTALEMERSGRDLYMDAAERVHDGVVTEVLVALANDESEHERMIGRYYKAMQDHAGWPEPPRHAAGEPITPAIEILQKTVADIRPDVSYNGVYVTACDYETRSRDFYRERMGQAEDRRLAEFFGFLARVEQAHLDALQLMLYASR